MATPRKRRVRTREMIARIRAASITSPIGKFCVGLTAGVSLIFLPPLLTTLAFAGASESDVSAFSGRRILIGLATALLVALIATIFEFRRSVQPRQVFLRALAAPDLVLGSWQSLADTYKLREAHREIHEVQDLAQTTSDIPDADTSNAPVPDSATSSTAQPSQRQSGTDRVFVQTPALLWVASARQLGASVKEQRYLVVLNRRADSVSAIARARERRLCCSRAAHRQQGRVWFVVDSPDARPKTDALKRALAIRTKYPSIKLDVQLLAATQ